MESQSPPDQPVALPGWYRDSNGQMRWWDGTRWANPTEQLPDSTWSIFSHLSWLVWPILCPLLVRIIRGKRDLFSRHHSTEALNAQLTFVALSLALIGCAMLADANTGASATAWLWVAFLTWGFAALVWTVLSIAGAVHAKQGTWWRYPFSIRFVPGATRTPPLPETPQDGPEQPTLPANASARRVTVILLGVLAGLAIVGGIVASVTSGHGTTAATDVAPGDCVRQLPTGSQLVGTLDTIACDQTHAGEVFAVLTMPDGQFPGESAVKAFADNCGPALVSYAPHASTDTLDVFVLYPTAESWTQGDRSLTCIASWDPPRAGSIKG